MGIALLMCDVLPEFNQRLAFAMSGFSKGTPADDG